MVLALNSIWNEGNFDLRIENYRDHWGLDIAPFKPAFIGARWVDRGRDRTVLTIRDPAPEPGEGVRAGRCQRRTAVISLEDIRWQLVLKGDVEGGPVAVDVDGNKDFDLVVKEDGGVLVRCLGGSFNAKDMQVALRVPPLLDPPCLPDEDDLDPLRCPEAIPSSSMSGLSASQLDFRSHSDAAHGPLSTPLTAVCHVNSYALQPSCSHTHRRFPPASYAMSEISPDLAMLLEELRADQRAVLQREFQMVGASFGERLWNGGRKLMGSYEPKEFLPMTAMINLLVIPAIFLFTYLYNHRRHRRSLACTPLFPSPSDSPTLRRRLSSRSGRRRRTNDDYAPMAYATDGVAVVRVESGEDLDGLPPPPYYPD